MEKFTGLLYQLLGAASQDPALGQVFSTFNINPPQVYMDIDREKAMAHGVLVSDIFATMQAVFGATYVNDFNLYGRTWQVNVQGRMDDRAKPEDILDVKVKNAAGGMVPLSSFVSLRMVKAAQALTRYNNYRAIAVNGSAAPDFRRDDAAGIQL